MTRGTWPVVVVPDAVRNLRARLLLAVVAALAVIAVGSMHGATPGHVGAASMAVMTGHGQMPGPAARPGLAPAPETCGTHDACRVAPRDATRIAHPDVLVATELVARRSVQVGAVQHGPATRARAPTSPLELGISRT